LDSKYESLRVFVKVTEDKFIVNVENSALLNKNAKLYVNFVNKYTGQKLNIDGIPLTFKGGPSSSFGQASVTRDTSAAEAFVVEIFVKQFLWNSQKPVYRMSVLAGKSLWDEAEPQYDIFANEEGEDAGEFAASENEYSDNFESPFEEFGYEDQENSENLENGVFEIFNQFDRDVSSSLEQQDSAEIDQRQIRAIVSMPLEKFPEVDYSQVIDDETKTLKIKTGNGRSITEVSLEDLNENLVKFRGFVDLSRTSSPIFVNMILKNGKTVHVADNRLVFVAHNENDFKFFLPATESFKIKGRVSKWFTVSLVLPV
jgi:hypothetical protein